MTEVWLMQAEIDRLRRRVMELEGQLRAHPVLEVGTPWWADRQNIRVKLSIPSYRLDDYQYVHSSMEISPLLWERGAKGIRKYTLDRIMGQTAVEWLKGRNVITIDDEKLLEEAA